MAVELDRLAGPGPIGVNDGAGVAARRRFATLITARYSRRKSERFLIRGKEVLAQPACEGRRWCPRMEPSAATPAITEFAVLVQENGLRHG